MLINLSGISSEWILNSLLIKYTDNLQGLLFIIPMLITVDQLNKQRKHVSTWNKVTTPTLL